MPSLTERLVDLIARKPIDDADRRAAAMFVLDALANALAGRNSEPGRILLAWAGERPGANADGFLAAALTHILEIDDLHRHSVTHPGCVVVPAAWAAAARSGAKGRALLDAVLAGYEAMCRIGNAVGPAHYRVFHNTATCGPFGSAMAVGRLLGLDPATQVHALGNAGTQSAGFWEFLETGAMSKHLHAGHAAEAGARAAQLAAHGFTGPPTILEGERGFFRGMCPDGDPDAVLRDPDALWELHRTSIKPWPSCRHTHPPIDAAASLREAIGNRPIARVTVETYPATLDLCDRAEPDSEYGAKFSLQHCVAAALARPVVDFAAFDAPARAELAPLRARIECRIGDRFAASYPRAWGAAVAVTLGDGAVLTAEREHAKGDPEAALDERAMREKAAMLLRHGGVARPEKLIDAVLALADDAALPSADPISR
ncbi:MAG: MmgE/PrpD family protein [Dongiaceae bacterium]